MISIKRKYVTARARLDALPQWAQPAEAFVLTTFFVEKILRRTLVQLMIRHGMTPAAAFETSNDKLSGLWKVRNAWKEYDPKKRQLEAVIGTDAWQTIKDAAKLRNELVHGSGYKAEKIYSQNHANLLKALDVVHSQFKSEYSYSGWRGMKDSAGNKI